MRAPATARPAFLNHAFAPITDTEYDCLRDKAKVERAFFGSLAHLSNLYGLTLSPAGSVYPYNLYLALQQARTQLAARNPGLELKVITDEQHPACLATLQTFDTDCLYYIPAQPLWQLLQEGRRSTANLLLSLFSLLYRKGVACWRDEDSALYYHYEMVQVWLQENPGDWEEGLYQRMLSDCHAQAWYGDRLFRRIRHPYHAERFGHYIEHFQPQSPWEGELKALCEQFGRLFLACPQGDFYRQLRPEIIDDGQDYVRYPDSYLSFFWTDNDSIYETLSEAVNNDLNECGAFLDPVAIQLFDSPQPCETHDLYFEWRFILLTGHLCTLLFEQT